MNKTFFLLILCHKINYFSSTILIAIKHMLSRAFQKSINMEHTLFFQAIATSFESLTGLYFYHIFRVFFGITTAMGITPRGKKIKPRNFSTGKF